MSYSKCNKIFKLYTHKENAVNINNNNNRTEIVVNFIHQKQAFFMEIYLKIMNTKSKEEKLFILQGNRYIYL